jgi:hypothetical protein
LRLFFLLSAMFFCFTDLNAQQPKDHALCVEVSIADPPNFSSTFSWENDNEARDYVIRRKLMMEDKWDTLAVLPPNTSEYLMDDFLDSTHYDISVIKNKEVYSSYSYFAFGTNIKLAAFKGTVLLIIDKTVSKPLEFELERFRNDMIGDGFAVISKEVPRTEEFDTNAVKYIKQIIDHEYITEPTLTTVILFGRIAVPYSGAYAIDGHIPDHLGAWPADVYYAAPESEWTDELVNAFSADDKRNRNIPGDGKFDETTIIGDVKLEIGRIDFYNLLVFEDSEIELLRKYLDKNHAFRQGRISVQKKGLIDDRLKYINFEPFSSGCWYNFYGIFGEENIDTLDYRNTLEQSSYLWSYGSNSGSYSSIAHVATADDYATRQTNGIFTSITGSYLADWDYKDNLLRCAIASSPSMLVSFFDGLPDWHYHNMSLGQTIGYATKITQNNRDLFKANDVDGFRQIHIALMGDPTLRMEYPKPPANFRIIDTVENEGKKQAVLKFHSVEGINRYNLYARDKNSNIFFLFDEINYDEFNLDIEHLDDYFFVLKSSKIEKVKTGWYINESTGIPLRISPPTAVIDKEQNEDLIHAFPNPARDNVTINFKNGLSHIDILDIHGNIIRSMEKDQILDNSVSWDLKDVNRQKVPSGVYIIRASESDKVLVAKVLVMY